MWIKLRFLFLFSINFNAKQRCNLFLYAFIHLSNHSLNLFIVITLKITNNNAIYRKRARKLHRICQKICFLGKRCYLLVSMLLPLHCRCCLKFTVFPLSSRLFPKNLSFLFRIFSIPCILEILIFFRKKVSEIKMNSDSAKIE